MSLEHKKLEEESGRADCHVRSHGHWIVDTPISNPMSIYSMSQSRKSWGIDAIGTVVCEVDIVPLDDWVIYIMGAIVYRRGTICHVLLKVKIQKISSLCGIKWRSTTCPLQKGLQSKSSH